MSTNGTNNKPSVKLRSNHFVSPNKYKKIFNEMTKISKNIYNCCVYSYNIFIIYKNEIYKDYYNMIKRNKKQINNDILFNDIWTEYGDMFFASIFNTYHNIYTQNKEIINKNNILIFSFIKDKLNNIVLNSSNIDNYKNEIYKELSTKIEYNEINKKIVFSNIIEKIIYSKYHKQYVMTKDELLNHKPLTYNDKILIDEIKNGQYYYTNMNKVNKYIEKIESLLCINRELSESKLFKSQQHLFKYSVYNYFLGENKNKLPADIILNIIDKYYTSIKSYYALVDKKIKANKPKYIDKNFNLFYYPSSFKIIKNKVRLTVGNHISNNLLTLSNKNLIQIENNCKATKYCQKDHIIKSKKSTQNFISFGDKNNKSYVNKNNIINGTYIYLDLPTKFKKLTKKNINHKIKLIEIKPYGNNFNVHISYEFSTNNKIQQSHDLKIKPTIENSISIDTGMKNLLTIYNPTGPQHIIKGNKLICINEFYNKKIAELQSINKKYLNKNSFNRLYSLLRERDNKLDGEINRIVDILVTTYNDKQIFIVGKNDGWKTKLNLGTNTNRKFYSIPYNKILLKLKSRLDLCCKKVITIEESYTSKCDSLSLELLCKKEKYNGTRKMRGLYISQNNKAINADLNGAINIMRKVINLKSITGKLIYNPTVL